MSLGETIVDISAQGLQRNGTLMILFYSCDLSAAYTAGELNLDTSCAQTHGTADSLLHGTAEGSTVLELSSDALCYQLGILVGLLNLNNIYQYSQLFSSVLIDHLFALETQLFDLGAALTDYDTGTGAVQMDSYLGGVALDLDLGDAGVIQLLLQDLAEVVVLYEGIPWK